MAGPLTILLRMVGPHLPPALIAAEAGGGGGMLPLCMERRVKRGHCTHHLAAGFAGGLAWAHSCPGTPSSSSSLCPTPPSTCTVGATRPARRAETEGIYRSCPSLMLVYDGRPLPCLHHRAYYTVAHILQNGVLNGQEGTPCGVRPEHMTDEVRRWAVWFHVARTRRASRCLGKPPRELLGALLQRVVGWHVCV